VDQTGGHGVYPRQLVPGTNLRTARPEADRKQLVGGKSPDHTLRIQKTLEDSRGRKSIKRRTRIRTGRVSRVVS
jgi:hypothetical protein